MNRVLITDVFETLENFVKLGYDTKKHKCLI